ncbi:MAG: hypothetical protein ABMA64_01840 [Myxococcota bacterium]
MRDLEDPTHAFPIGSMSRTGSRKARLDPQSEDLDLGPAPVVHAGDDDWSDSPPPRTAARPMIDARFVVAWLIVAGGLVALAALAVAVAVLYS